MYESKMRSDGADALFRAILALRDEEECYRFFDDICTAGEFHAIVQRFEVARLLGEKKTFQDISQLTGASTATIARVNRALKYGAEGYRLALDRAHPDE